MAASDTIPPEVISKHNKSEDCWVIVHNKVYDVTSFLEKHPGGPHIILQYAGLDATTAYDEVHAPGIIEESLPKEAYKGSISDSDLERLPKLDKPTASPDQSSAPEPESSAPKSYEKPLLDSLINVYDFEAVAEKLFSPKAWAFYSGAATDLYTHRLNSSLYSRIWLRPRILRNVKTVSTQSSILGFPTSLPLFVAPAAMARLAHPDGELAMARACRDEDIVQVISTNASFPLAQIVRSSIPEGSQESPAQIFFLQLYVNVSRQQTVNLLKHTQELGVKAIFVTVDAPIAGKRESDERIAFDTSLSSGISGAGSKNATDTKGGGIGRLMGSYVDCTLTWDDIPWIHSASGELPLVIKGIQTAADAKKAIQHTRHGVRGIMLSNHGGRSLDTSQPAIITLLEMWKVCPEIFEALEVYIDGGIHRGTDVVKALALGATAVGVGRSFLYSLAYGQEGMHRMIKIYRDEVEVTLRMLGITDINDLHPGLLNTRDIDRLVPDEDGQRHPYAGRGRNVIRSAKL
ncbi:MAG: hypothetical protein LQ340_005803 [Diploschistes diacapsis]|nr:MAG: hypothetical protein LQ340_005803 [Diploschistes diacapsis]